VNWKRIQWQIFRSSFNTTRCMLAESL